MNVPIVGLVQALMPIVRLGAISAQKGAETLIYLASSPEVAEVTGKYFYQGKAETPSAAAEDDAAAARLWAESEHLAAAVAQAA